MSNNNGANKRQYIECHYVDQETLLETLFDSGTMFETLDLQSAAFIIRKYDEAEARGEVEVAYHAMTMQENL